MIGQHTLAKKFEAVHKNTVTSRRPIPSVRRAKPPSVFGLREPDIRVVSDDLQEDEEARGDHLWTSSSSSAVTLGSAAAAMAELGETGGNAPLIVPTWRQAIQTLQTSGG